MTEVEISNLRNLLSMLNSMYGMDTQLKIVDGDCAEYRPFSNTINLGYITLIKEHKFIDWILCHEFKHALDHVKKKRIVRFQKKLIFHSIIFWAIIFFAIINSYSLSFLDAHNMIGLSVFAIIPYFLIVASNSKYTIIHRKKLQRINHYIEHRADLFASKITGKNPSVSLNKMSNYITTFTHPSWVDRVDFLLKRIK